MDGNKAKYLWEIIYNCPFILLVLVTSLLAAPFFDRIGDWENDEKTAVFQPMEERTEPIEERPHNFEVFDKIFGSGLNIDNRETAASESSLNAEEKKAENEGTRKEENSNIESEKGQNSDTKRTESAAIQPREEIHATQFVEYAPIETNSRYYSDAGKVALTTAYDYILENDSYFNDAVFLGDSRTLGISDYAGFDDADFFCDNGMTIYKLLEDAGVTWQRTGEKMDMKKILQEKRYGKIYIMLGMNELGYGNTTMYLKQYLKVIRQLKEWQPDAVIYVMANLHVSREKNNMESEFNNININDKNVAAARLADGRGVFYLDCNPLFTDDEGYLKSELTFDGVHLYAQHYDKWRTFLLEHGVERKEAAEYAAEGEKAAEYAGEGEEAAEHAAESEDAGVVAADIGEE